MITPSKVSNLRTLIRVPSCLVLMLHGSTLTPVYEFFLSFVIAPILLISVYYGLQIFFRSDNYSNLMLSKQNGLPPTKGILATLFLYTFLPVGIVFSGMIYAEARQSYEGVYWIPIWFVAFTLDDVISRFIANMKQ